MIAIKKLFDDGEDVLRRNSNITLLHGCSFILFIILFVVSDANVVPNEV